MSSSRWAVSCAATFVLLAAASAAPWHTALGCTAPLEMTHFKVGLPNTAGAIHSSKALVIVSIGSSSTKGVGASNPAYTYPALLSEDLRHRWPQLAVTVVNKGVSGEIASQMLGRFEDDVLPYHPQLVIWQTGTNQALRTGDIGGYVDTVREGISRLKATRADVILMDPQFSPRVLARPTHPFIVDSISALAHNMNVAVFRRFTVMRHLISSGQYKMEDLISSDGLHMNDVSYSCIARLLANSIAAAATPGNHGRGRNETARGASR
jgi:acyl-CoA thioesterase I